MAEQPGTQRPIRPHDHCVYLDTLTCDVLEVHPDKGTALVYFAGGLDPRLVALDELTIYAPLEG